MVRMIYQKLMRTFSEQVLHCQKLCKNRNIYKQQNKFYCNIQSEVLPAESSVENSSTSYEKFPPIKNVEDNINKLNQTFIYVKNRRMRYNKAIIMLEGKRLIQDAFQANVTAKMIFFSRKSCISGLDFPLHCYDEKKPVLWKAKYEYIQMWSDLTTSPGVMGIFEMPNLMSNSIPVGATPIIIVCDNIREPGNLGSILRIAASIPVSKVVLTRGCVDLWDSKVIRSSCGSHFKIPIENNVDWASIIADYEGYVLLADCLWFSEYEADLNKPIKDTYESKLSRKNEVPIVPYYCVHYDKVTPMILVIGGETEGLSNYSYDFAIKRNGMRINIPLSNYCDSLNSGVALGTILFEIKRTLLKCAE